MKRAATGLFVPEHDTALDAAYRGRARHPIAGDFVATNEGPASAVRVVAPRGVDAIASGRQRGVERIGDVRAQSLIDDTVERLRGSADGVADHCRQAIAAYVQLQGEYSANATYLWKLEWGKSLKERQGCAAARPRLERVVEVLAQDPGVKPAWLPTAYLLAATCRLEAGEAVAARAAAVVARDAYGPDPDPAVAGPEPAQARALIAACDAALAVTSG